MTDRRPLLWWDLGAAVTLIALVVMSQIIGTGEVSPRWAAGLDAGARTALLLAPLAGFATLYLALGRRALRRGMLDEPLGRAGVGFLIVLLSVLAWAVFTEPMFALLQVLAYPIVWSIVPRYRDAVLWSLGVALAGEAIPRELRIASPA